LFRTTKKFSVLFFLSDFIYSAVFSIQHGWKVWRTFPENPVTTSEQLKIQNNTSDNFGTNNDIFSWNLSIPVSSQVSATLQLFLWKPLMNVNFWKSSMQKFIALLPFQSSLMMNPLIAFRNLKKKCYDFTTFPLKCIKMYVNFN
jgi:hypothetical protein